jgi:hypothetical protein
MTFHPDRRQATTASHDRPASKQNPDRHQGNHDKDQEKCDEKGTHGKTARMKYPDMVTPDGLVHSPFAGAAEFRRYARTTIPVHGNMFHDFEI